MLRFELVSEFGLMCLWGLGYLLMMPFELELDWPLNLVLEC